MLRARFAVTRFARFSGSVALTQIMLFGGSVLPFEFVRVPRVMAALDVVTQAAPRALVWSMRALHLAPANLI